MTIRRYLSPVAGTGTGLQARGDHFRPLVLDLAPITSYTVADHRLDERSSAGTVMIEADVTAGQHASILANPAVQGIPLEDAGGAALADSAPISGVPLAKRNAIRTRLEALGIPAAQFTAATTVGEVIAWIRQAMAFRQWLRSVGIDLDEPLADVWRSMTQLRRNRIRSRLIEGGYDLSVLDEDDTVEQAIVKLLVRRVTTRAGAASAQSRSAAAKKPTTKKRAANGRKRN